jgi:DNA-binding LacI/PurR family transcriptional regulator
MISDPFVLGILGSLTDTVNDLGMNLLLTRLQENREDQMRSMVESGQVNGLVVIGQLALHDHLNELAQQGIPMAVWGANLEGASYPVVGGDNLRGGYLATRHLIEKGCRRIAFFGDTNHPEAGLRFQGYTQALQEVGIEPDPRLRQHYLFGDARIRETIDGWLNQQLDFDAIFACSDVTAISLMGALRERGVHIPGQVRVVGYDDILLSMHVHPTLTTVRQPIEQAGRALVALLFESMAGAPRRNIVLPTELIVRDSSL